MRKYNSKLKIFHVIAIFSLLIILLRFETILSGYLFLVSFAGSFFNFGNKIFSLIDFPLIDILASVILILVIPVVSLLKKNKIRILQSRISFLSSFLIIVFFAFIFAPLITNINPIFFKDHSVTKLLPPLSKVKILHLVSNEEEATNNALSELKYLKDKIVKKSFNENIIYADSIKVNNVVTYYQKNIPHEIERSLCEEQGGQVKISSQFYLFGSDDYGRDIFTRIIYGARISILVGIGSIIIILVLGIGLGFFAGLKGGTLNLVLTRITEMFLYIPNIFLVILILALFGNSLQTVIIVLGLSGWMPLFKIVKSEVVAIKGKDFIISSRKIGLSDKMLLLNEALPVIASPVLFTLISMFASIILAEASLSFLGIGGSGEYPSWGSMIHAGQGYLSHAWWMLIFPGSILVALLFSINELGRRVRVSLNPRMQKND